MYFYYYYYYYYYYYFYLQDKQQLEAIEDVPPVDVSTLEEEVETLAREIVAHQESLDVLGAHYKEIHTDYEKMSKEYRTLDEQMKKFADQVEPIKVQVDSD